jgi:hypothetical protein
MVSVAGEVASKVEMSAGDVEDLRRAVWLGELGDFTSDLARKRLDGRQATVDRIAEALMLRGCLSGDEFRQLLAEDEG